jgi:excisionase family DNA binding protein
MIYMESLLSPREVAKLLHVKSDTVTRWANKGLLRSVRTPGGHRRYLEADVLALLRGEGD